jgi:hypothetical protein
MVGIVAACAARRVKAAEAFEVSGLPGPGQKITSKMTAAAIVAAL